MCTPVSGVAGTGLFPGCSGCRSCFRTQEPTGAHGAGGRARARQPVEQVVGGLVRSRRLGQDDALVDLGVDVKRVLLIGGAAKNPAISTIASALFGREVLVPQPGEYVADGAARQAAWALSGGATPPQWNLGDVTSTHSPATPEVVDAYRTLRDRTINW